MNSARNGASVRKGVSHCTPSSCGHRPVKKPAWDGSVHGAVAQARSNRIPFLASRSKFGRGRAPVTLEAQVVGPDRVEHDQENVGRTHRRQGPTRFRSLLHPVAAELPSRQQQDNPRQNGKAPDPKPRSLLRRTALRPRAPIAPRFRGQTRTRRRRKLPARPPRTWAGPGGRSAAAGSASPPVGANTW